MNKPIKRSFLDRYERVLLEQVLVKQKCLKCGSDKDLTIHHIKPVSKYPLLEFDKKNCIILCKKCHTKLHGRRKRFNWETKKNG